MLPSPSVMDRARALHRSHTSVPAFLGAQAPGTWCIVGEHTEAFGGTVVMLPLNLATAVVLSPREDGCVCLRGEFAGVRISLATARLRHTGTGSDMAQRAARLITTLIQRQMLSRDTTGFDITVCSDVPLGSGLGARHSFDTALGLALYPEAHDASDAPARARLASACSQAARYLDDSVVRTRHIASLRGRPGRPCVVDYSDGSVTDVPALHSSEAVALAIGVSGEDPHAIDSTSPSLNSKDQQARHRLIKDATHAFGTEYLRLLPDATPRVLDWLKAVFAVHGPQGYPSLEEAATLLAFWEAETRRSHRLVSLLRGRRTDEVPMLLNESRAAITEAYQEEHTPLTQICLRHGAMSVRPAHAGLSRWVTVLVDAEHAASLHTRIVQEEIATSGGQGLEVVRLHAGDIAHVPHGA
ncbi:hypothetical protein H7347_00970 [Corynebacterium sp. zg-331]|uniref:galactokinase family protein n=1 Tax=unclassified Corynebacterium TaxID=2624378 RepID=UPI00128D8F13|nr:MULTISPECIES: galactokinase family protein [unclassified Corynebacterium]MBC3185157.1 hypothetical protein [Corynebacterium sp. zg-331]MPV51655.1 hypothetical protein [Corynebacterium sp. zg331]